MLGLFYTSLDFSSHVSLIASLYFKFPLVFNAFMAIEIDVVVAVGVDVVVAAGVVVEVGAVVEAVVGIVVVVVVVVDFL